MARVDRYGFKGVSSKADIDRIESLTTDSVWAASTYDAVLDSVRDNKNEPALSFFMLGNEYKKPFQFTYSDVLKEINQLANLLYKFGVRKGEAVGIILPNLPETCFSLIAAQTVGIAFPINPLLEKKQLKELMVAAEIKVLITIGPFVKTDVWEKVNEIRLDVPTLKDVIQIDMNHYLRGVKKAIVGLIKGFKDSGKTSNVQTVSSYRSLLKGIPRDHLNFERNNLPNDAAAYFHTGGTTGRPKIAVQTQENICFDCWSTGQNLNTNMDEFNVYGGLPLFHVFGAMVTLSLCWAGSGHLILVSPQGFRGDGVMSNFWKTVSHYRINVVAAVPAIYKMLNDASDGSSSDTLKFAISGAAPLPIEVMKSFKKNTNVEILEGYGCTEGACMVAVNPPYGLRKLGSVGFPIPFTELKILKLENDTVREMGANTIGQVHLKGKNVFKGYLESEHNENIWTDFNGEKYFNTGDLGKIDEDGYVWLTGREKELIIRGGHNIDPMSIEDPMYGHPDVEMVAAVGRPDARVGELPVLYVQLKSGSLCTNEDLLSYAKEHISEQAAIPKLVILIDEIPLTTIGKIFKPALCLLQIEEVFRDVVVKFQPQAVVNAVNSMEKGYCVEISGVALNSQNEISESLHVFSVGFNFRN